MRILDGTVTNLNWTGATRGRYNIALDEEAKTALPAHGRAVPLGTPLHKASINIAKEGGSVVGKGELGKESKSFY